MKKEITLKTIAASVMLSSICARPMATLTRYTNILLPLLTILAGALFFACDIDSIAHTIVDWTCNDTWSRLRISIERSSCSNQ